VSLEGGQGEREGIPRFCFALHLLHSVLRVLVDPWSFVEWFKDVMAPAICCLEAAKSICGFGLECIRLMCGTCVPMCLV
jgi:hypothetical protein